MYARLVRFSLGPGKREIAQAVADDMPPKIAAMKGCRSVTVFGDDSDGEYGIFVLWESEADADAAAPVIGPQIHERIGGHVTADWEARLFEVLSE
jgi:Antibiotic biosynthesis monooxygenase